MSINNSIVSVPIIVPMIKYIVNIVIVYSLSLQFVNIIINPRLNIDSVVRMMNSSMLALVGSSNVNFIRENIPIVKPIVIIVVCIMLSFLAISCIILLWLSRGDIFYTRLIKLYIDLIQYISQYQLKYMD